MNIKSALMAATVVFCTATALFPTPAVAVPSKSLNVELGPGVEVITTINLEQTEVRDTALPYLRRVRANMYDIGIPFQDTHNASLGTTLPDVVASYGLSRDEYVNGLEWSGDMERISVQRSVEEKYSGQISHARANNASSFTATIAGGSFTRGENLCQGHLEVENCLEALTYGEENDLRRSNGAFTSGSGHLHNILNPGNSYVGVGAVDRFYATHHSNAPSSTKPLPNGYTVLSIAVPPRDILQNFSLQPYRSHLAPGESTDVVMHNNNGFDLPGTLESSDPGVATVMGTTVTAMELGTTTITFRSRDGGFTDSTTITVAERSALSGGLSSMGSSNSSS